MIRGARTFRKHTFTVDTDQVLAFRLARSGLAIRAARSLPEAAACPASDFARDAALLALAARAEDVSGAAYRRAIDAGELVVAHVIRGAIHALAPGDHALYGPDLVARETASWPRSSGSRSSAWRPRRASRRATRSTR